MILMLVSFHLKALDHSSFLTLFQPSGYFPCHPNCNVLLSLHGHQFWRLCYPSNSDLVSIPAWLCCYELGYWIFLNSQVTDGMFKLLVHGCLSTSICTIKLSAIVEVNFLSILDVITEFIDCSGYDQSSCPVVSALESHGNSPDFEFLL